MSKFLDILGEAEPISGEDFRAIANLQYEPAGIALVGYLEATIKRDLDSLMRIKPDDTAAIAQLQARIDASGQLRALITVDPSAYDDEEEENDG